MIITPPPLVLNLGIVLTFVGFSTSSGTTISPHASAAAGDIAVLADSSSNSSPTAVTPTGNGTWTNHVNQLNGNHRHMVSSVILTGTGSITGMASAGEDVRKVLMIFRPSAPLASITANDVSISTTSSGGGQASVTINASGGASPLIVIGSDAARGSGITPDLGSSPSLDATQSAFGTTLKNRAGYKIYNSAPADHTLTGNASGPGANSEIVTGLWLEPVAA